MSFSRLEILNDGGLRHDARRPYELRTLACRLAAHPQADGSASVSSGLTTVSVAVYGPREPLRGTGGPGGQGSDRGTVIVEVGVAPWAGTRDVNRTRGDKCVVCAPYGEGTELTDEQTTTGDRSVHQANV